MARVLLAWEIGADYGHVMRLSIMARELSRRGHEPIFALKDLTHVETVLGGDPFKVFQAPVWRARVTGLAPAAGFAETMLRVGFLHPNALSGMCRAWRSLIDLLGPRLIVADYAPTALLATRGLGLPRVTIGEGFSMPPPTEPLPPYRWWRGESQLRMIEAEGHALAGANAALAHLGQPPMRRLADLLQTDEQIMTVFEEFDQYPDRAGAKYWGALPGLDRGVAPAWPDAGPRRVFAYLKPLSRDFGRVLIALRSLDVSVVVHAPGVSEKLLRTHMAANIQFSAKPLRMADVCREADLGICHAGSSTTQALVASGIPVLLLPEHLEQMMTAKRVSALGAGLLVDFEKPAPDFKRLLNRLLGEPSFRAAAQAVAARHADDDPRTRVARIADRLEELLTDAAPEPAPVPGN